VSRSGADLDYELLRERWRRLATRGARVRRIGRSVEGEKLVSVEVGDAEAPRATVLLAGVHPMEWIGVEVAHALLEALAADPPAGRRIVAFPLVNVDGFRRVASDLRAGRRRFLRVNANGVDLNRNWPAGFRASRFRPPTGWNWGGGAALSEPETAAVAARVEAVAGNARIDRALSLHSVGRRILLPWGRRFEPPEEIARLRRAAAAIRARMPERYVVSQVSHWIPGALARGVEIDYLHERFGALAFIVECSAGGLSLRDPGSWIRPFAWYNPPARERAACPIAAALLPFARGADR
jgi:predicted deacylase